MTKTIWQPWNLPEDHQLPEKLGFIEPPCKYCKFWYPHYEVAHGKVSGFCACISEKMYHDFSCYKPEME